MKLNCDLGESFGAWSMGADNDIMPLIDQANIACGMHAGDPVVMQQSVSLAVKHKVQIGAHPSYPDRQGFGRRSMVLSRTELTAVLHYQLSTLQGMARLAGAEVEYVKPHGALYNDMAGDTQLRQTVFEAIAAFEPNLKVMVLADANRIEIEQQANALGLEVIFEAFADRRYSQTGSLLPRSEPGALLSHNDALRQVSQLLSQGTVADSQGAVLAVKADSLCVHGDNPQALALVRDIRAMVPR